MVKVTKTNLQDCYILEPDRFGDDRGYFSPYFIQKDLDKLGIKFEGVVQANRSKSSKGVVRGLHFQKDPKCQTKIVEVISGKAIDVVVDIREGSPTYGKSTAVLLTPDNNRQLYVPRGFAHGFIIMHLIWKVEYFGMIQNLELIGMECLKKMELMSHLQVKRMQNT